MINSKILEKIKEQNFYFDDNSFFFDFNEKLIKLEKMYNYLKEKTNDNIITRGKHNYCSPLVIVLKNKSQDNILKLYEGILKKRNIEINDIYISYYDKCSDSELNKKAFIKEIKILQCDNIIAHSIPVKSKKIINIDYDGCVKSLFLDDTNIEEKKRIKEYLLNKIKPAFNEYFKFVKNEKINNIR